MEWRCLVQCPVRPMGVEVRHVLGQHSLKLVPVEDQHPIQQLTAAGDRALAGDVGGHVRVAPHPRPELEIVLDRERRKYLPTLWHLGDATCDAPVWRPTVDRLALEGDGAGTNRLYA